MSISLNTCILILKEHHLLKSSAVQDTVQTGKINIFKYTMCSFFSGKLSVGSDSLPGNDHHLTRLHITDKFCSYGSQRTAFRSKNISMVSFSDTKRFQPIRIADTDEFSRTHDHQSVSTF